MKLPDDPLVTVMFSIGRNGDVVNDTQTHDNSFADVYRGLVAVRAEVDRQINERRNCPYNPAYGKEAKR